MVKFFIPGLKAGVDPLDQREHIKKQIQDAMECSITDRKIFRMKHRDVGKNNIAEVGKEHPINSEPVMLIFECSSHQDLFLICTPHRRIIPRGEGPILVGKNEIISIEDFD